MIVMGTLTAVVKDEYIKMIDIAIKKSGLYCSRSEFIKDAIRDKFESLLLIDDDLKRIRNSTRTLALKARSSGWNGKMPTREERVKIADAYLKKNGFTKNQ